MDFISNRKKIYVAAILIVGALCLSMAIFPSIAFFSAQKGIALWANTVLPALLPFFICANFMNHMGVTRVLNPSAFAFSMSVISGYPMGAKIIGDLRRDETISENEAKRMLSFCSTSGPAFMLGAVGVGMLGSPLLGMVIAVSHYLGALLNGRFFSLRFRKEKHQNRTIRRLPELKKGILETFTDSAFASFKSLGIILAYIMLFMFVTDLMQFSGVLTIFEQSHTRALVKGIFEMTVGCASIASSMEISELLKVVFCTLIISWGGFSIIGQTMSMLTGCNISLTYLVTVKLGHCIFSSVIAFILGILLMQ